MLLVLALGLAAASGSIASAQAVASAPPQTRPERFEAQITAMLERDRTAPPPRPGILFVGSSIFRLWADLETHMAPLPVFNRAFGGSRTEDLLHYMDRIVLPYAPPVIAYYCGSNDVNAGASAAAILQRTHEFIERVHAALPATQIVYFSINKALDKRDKWALVEDVNAAMKATTTRWPWVTYVESNTALFDEKGEPRADLYLADGLHFKPPAYTLFTGILKPVIADAWRDATKR